ncbi:MAG: hypothetical protein WBE76_04005 [Terracidiphilus sp.]
MKQRKPTSSRSGFRAKLAAHWMRIYRHLRGRFSGPDPNTFPQSAAVDMAFRFSD